MAKGLKKGQTNNPNGRKKGVPNKVTRDIRESFKNLVENNLDNMTKWLERVALNEPEKALKIVADLSEYILPKLQRTELTGKDGSDLIPQDPFAKIRENNQ